MFHGVIHKITLAQFFETRCIYWVSEYAVNEAGKHTYMWISLWTNKNSGCLFFQGLF